MTVANTSFEHFAWLAKSFGRTDYLPLTRADLEALSTTGSYIEKYPGTHLFREGAPSIAAFVIQRGEVELYRTRGEGKKVVGRIKAGSVIGDIAMFRNEPYLQSARAVDRVTAFRIDRNKLLPVLLEHPTVALRWLVAGLSQLETTQRRVVRLMHRTVKQQVAELLLDEADAFGEVRLSQSAIADMLGASRQSVNEALAELRSCNAVDTGYRMVRLMDRSQLCTLAGQPD